MRISDWSSDVCSSDLTALNYGRPTSLEGEDPAFIHDFTLKLPPSVDETALLPHVPVIEAAIAAVLEGSAENDAFNRSEERRVGKEGVRTCRSRWSPDH